MLCVAKIADCFLFWPCSSFFCGTCHSINSPNVVNEVTFRRLATYEWPDGRVGTLLPYKILGFSHSSKFASKPEQGVACDKILRETLKSSTSAKSSYHSGNKHFSDETDFCCVKLKQAFRWFCNQPHEKRISRQTVAAVRHWRHNTSGSEVIHVFVCLFIPVSCSPTNLRHVRFITVSSGVSEPNEKPSPLLSGALCYQFLSCLFFQQECGLRKWANCVFSAVLHSYCSKIVRG